MKPETVSVLALLASLTPLAAANACRNTEVAIGINLKNEPAMIANDCGVIDWLPGRVPTPNDFCSQVGGSRQGAPWNLSCESNVIKTATHTKSDAVDTYDCREEKDSGCNRVGFDVSYCCSLQQQ